MGYNGRLSLKILEKSVKVQNLPYPLLCGQPLKLRCDQVSCYLSLDQLNVFNFQPELNSSVFLLKHNTRIHVSLPVSE